MAQTGSYYQEGVNPYYQDKWVQIFHGDCRELSLENISALVTDPPYNLVSISKRFSSPTAHNTPAMDTPEGSVWARKARGFMGKEWDGTGVSLQRETWQHLRGLCLSGAPLLSFGGTRTFHRIACAIEDAGWEIRDTIMWVYGSGFPKSHNVANAVDKLQGLPQRGHAIASGSKFHPTTGLARAPGELLPPYEARTELGKMWEGYGTALKPAYEPIILGMNPLDGTFAENALKHKVAGLNIDGCRIPTDDTLVHGGSLVTNSGDTRTGKALGMFQQGTPNTYMQNRLGRFPANFIHDGSQLVLELFPQQAGAGGQASGRTARTWGTRGIYGGANGDGKLSPFYGDNGSAARFFYCAKASKAERELGCDGLEPEQPDPSRKEGNPGGDNPRNRGVHKVHNNHPTVKPLALMEYLVKLVKMPEYNLVLDPFMGSGTTLLACIRLGIPCIGIDNDEHTCEIAARRCCQEVMELVA